MTRLRATNPSGTDGRPARSLPAPTGAATPTARDGAGRTTTRSRPRPRSRPRREQVLDGAGQLFAEYGYYGASLRHIAREVGLSHPGMLHHFATKDELLSAVIDRLEAHAQDALDRLDELCTEPEALLQALTEVWHPGSPAIRLLARLDADVVSADHPGKFRIARLHRVHEHLLEHCFTALAEQGLLREGTDPAFAGRAMLALILNHAARERTVRAMQNVDHADSPTEDLHRLAGLFLAPGAAASSRPAV